MKFSEQVQQLEGSYAEIANKQPEAIALLNTVHKALFGTSVRQGCGDCNLKAFTAIQKHIYLQKQKSNFNLDNMKKFNDKNFVLKEGKVLSIGFTAENYINDNLTDEIAIKLLSRHPNLLKNFAKYPGVDSATKELDLSLIEDFDGSTLAQKKTAIAAAGNTGPAKAKLHVVKTAEDIIRDKVNNPPAGRTKGDVLQLLPGETVAEYEARTEVSERTVYRYIKAGKITNYDEETKAGVVPVSTEGEQGKPKEQGKVAVSLISLLTPEGLIAADLYDLDAMQADLDNSEDIDTQIDDTDTVSKFFNGLITDAAEAGTISEGIAIFLKAAPEQEAESEKDADNKGTEGAEGVNDTDAPADKDKGTDEGAKGADAV